VESCNHFWQLRDKLGQLVPQGLHRRLALAVPQAAHRLGHPGLPPHSHTGGAPSPAPPARPTCGLGFSTTPQAGRNRGPPGGRIGRQLNEFCSLVLRSDRGNLCARLGLTLRMTAQGGSCSHSIRGAISYADPPFSFPLPILLHFARARLPSLSPHFPFCFVSRARCGAKASFRPVSQGGTGSPNGSVVEGWGAASGGVIRKIIPCDAIDLK
jgi:hypothetical protein